MKIPPEATTSEGILSPRMFINGVSTCGNRSVLGPPAVHDRIATLLADLHGSWADLAKVLEGAGKVAGDAGVLAL